MPQHDPEDGDGAHEIQAGLAGGGCVEKSHAWLL
jgi:hypothetical protein